MERERERERNRQIRLDTTRQSQRKIKRLGAEKRELMLEKVKDVGHVISEIDVLVAL